MTKIDRRTFGVALGALVGLGGIAAADTIRVPRDVQRLGEALAIAQDGDRILVRGEHYVTAHQVLTADNVTVVGRRAVVNGDLMVTGDNVTIRGLRFTGDLRVDGSDATVKRNRFQGGSARLYGDDARLHRNRFLHTGEIIAADVQADDVTVSRNRFKAGMCAIVAEGDGITVEDNRVDDAHEAGVIVIGDDAVVDDNVVTDVTLMDGVTVVGDDAEITNNRVDGAPGGIRVEGDDVEVTDNRCDVGFDDPDLDIGLLNGCPGITVVCEKPGGVVEDNVVAVANGTGIHLEMDEAVIADNDVRQDGRIADTAIEVRGDRNTITGNDTVHDRKRDRFVRPMLPADIFWADTNHIHGVAVDGDDNVIDHNRVRDSDGTGIVADGDGNRIAGNKVSNPAGHAVAVGGRLNTVRDTLTVGAGGDGIIVSGPGNTIDSNVVRDADGCGILLLDPAVVTDCTVTGCDMGGLVNEGDGTTVKDSEFRGNAPFDVANVGRFQSFEGNVAARMTDDPRDLPDHQLVTPFPLHVVGMPPFGTPLGTPIDPGRNFPGDEEPFFGFPGVTVVFDGTNVGR